MHKLTKRADQVLKIAKEIATEYGYGYVGTEHLLLAILREGTSVGAQILRDHGADEEAARQVIDELLKDRMHETWVMGRLPGTPHYRDVLSKAANIARGRGNWQICSLHLLLGLMEEKNSTGYKALQALNITPEVLRRALSQQAVAS